MLLGPVGATLRTAENRCYSHNGRQSRTVACEIVHARAENMRNYVRKKSYKTMSDEHLNISQLLIERGYSIRKAAKEIGFDEKTLRNRLKTQKVGVEFGRKKTFNREQEDALLRHCAEFDKRYFGLTLKSLRCLLFQFAEENKIPHQFSSKSQLASKDFTKYFMKRNNLSLQVPSKTCAARTYSRIQLSTCFKSLLGVMEKFHFGHAQIYSLDETGLQTGKRDVSKTVAAEQHLSVTVVCAMSASAHYIPPFFIYPRKKINLRLLIKKGPTGCDMGITDKGHMTAPTFLIWLKHFKKYTNPTENRPILLIMDNDASHTTLEAARYAESNHIHLLTLPLHSSHMTQPLHRNFFQHLKNFYNAEVVRWYDDHPGEVFKRSHVAEAFKTAFQKAGTIDNAVQGFESTGIHPLDENKFTSDDFLSADTGQEPPYYDEEMQEAENQMFVVFDQPDVEFYESTIKLEDHEASTSISQPTEDHFEQT